MRRETLLEYYASAIVFIGFGFFYKIIIIVKYVLLIKTRVTIRQAPTQCAKIIIINSWIDRKFWQHFYQKFANF